MINTVIRSMTILAILMSFAPTSSTAQGGQGGGLGGGGFGGGGRGGGMNELREDDVAKFTHILTPGDRGEWPITVRENETIIAGAQSTVFDPAIEVVDSAGKIIAQNDDIRPGLQDALVLVRFPKAGAYKILVKGFKSAGGGQYTFTIRRFIPKDIRIGERATGSSPRGSAEWYRVQAESGQTLVVTSRAATFKPALNLYAPNGEQLAFDPERGRGSARGERAVVRVAAKGSYHVRVGVGVPGASFALTVAAARILPATLGARPAAQALDAGGLDIWTFKGKTGDLVRINANSEAAPVQASLDWVPPDAAGEAPAGRGGSASVELLESDPKNAGEVVAVLRETGNYQVSVQQPLGLETRYAMTVSTPTRAWTVAQEQSGSLVLGGADFWAIDGKAGDIVRVSGASQQFDIAIDFYNARGERIEGNDDGSADRNTLMTAQLTEPGRHYLRVHAFGDGGSGTYRLKRIPDPVHSLQVGATASGTAGIGGNDLWSFAGKTGQTVILSVRSTEFDTYVKIVGPDGLEIGANDDGGDGTNSLLSVRLPTTGKYTIWVSGKAGGGKYSIQLIEAQ